MRMIFAWTSTTIAKEENISQTIQSVYNLRELNYSEFVLHTLI